ncbi:putative phage abortive infection protein [Vibrio sinaloensis]|uniref:putative phage abortive infection protein n=1 Tax=Photobacterium sp. (strain ATCC 43367) TaxID=379097 RepID=UPI0035E6676C
MLSKDRVKAFFSKMSSEEYIKKLRSKVSKRLGRASEVIAEFSDERVNKSLFWLFFIALISVFGVFAVGFIFNDNGELGPWGDFVGGVLNPILTFITFMGLLITIVMQNRELKDTRAEAKRSADALSKQNTATDKQSFEQTLFNMLSLHQQILSSIDLHNSSNDKVTLGRDCFSVFFKRYESIAVGRYIGPHSEYEDDVAEIRKLDGAWQEFWKSHQKELGHYFRFLYNIVRFIDESNVDKTTYMRIVRAQLSDQELALLFYNCLSKHGRDKFKPLVESYTLFDNLPLSMLLREEHKYLYDISAFQGVIELDEQLP